MRRNALAACIVGAVLMSSGVTQTIESDSEMIEYDRRLAEKHTTVFPAAGIIQMRGPQSPSHWLLQLPIWGRIRSHPKLPLRADLKGNVWTVIGNPHYMVAKWAAS